MVENHKNMVGPNTAPMSAVPRFWTRNKRNRMNRVTGTTTGRNIGVTTSKPSIALNTVIAGVIMPSDKSKDEPNNPNTITYFRGPLCGSVRLSSSVSNAMIPPSPWLSARITKVKYLTTTTRINVQKTRESTPSTFSRMTANPCVGTKHSLMAYRGEVPISPYTTPNAPKANQYIEGRPSRGMGFSWTDSTAETWFMNHFPWPSPHPSRGHAPGPVRSITDRFTPRMNKRRFLEWHPHLTADKSRMGALRSSFPPIFGQEPAPSQGSRDWMESPRPPRLGYGFYPR